MRTRFETEAQGNSEIAYSVASVTIQNTQNYAVLRDLGINDSSFHFS